MGLALLVPPYTTENGGGRWWEAGQSISRKGNRMSIMKEEARRIVEQLSEEATWEDLQYQIAVRQRVELGRREVSEGRLIPHEEVAGQMSKWLIK